MVRILRESGGMHFCPRCGRPAFREMGVGDLHCSDVEGCGHVWSDKEI